MTFASDQNSTPEKLSATSRKMLELRNEVFSEWEKRIRASIKQAGTLMHPILVNTLPTFYDNIAEAITPEYPRTSAVDTTTIATEHGGERARLTDYDPQAIIHEYQTLRWSILDVLARHGVRLQEDELLTINVSIEKAIREAVTAFSVAFLALREQFMATLTHDLRNPLATATMSAELIARTTDSSEIKNWAERIIENNDRMDRMIRDLLDTVVFQGSGRLQLDLSSFDILDLVTEVEKHSVTAYGPRFHVTRASVLGWWSREAMKRALENLIGNAIKYGSADRPVSIKIDRIDGRLLVSVHNEGNPIPPEELEDIFQIFQRAKAAKESRNLGWGIGLPYVRRVAESHGGSVTVDSSAERGTTFLIDVPIDARPFQNMPTLPGPN